MEKAVFDKFRALVFDTTGISLSEQKEALVTARIGKRMRALSMTDFGRYFAYVTADKTGSELRELVNAISTNVTHFFRESRHFEFLAGALKQWPPQQRQGPRVWCAACSTGEEAYTIAMVALENLPQGIVPQIVASDISTKVLQIAKFGVYKDTDVERLPKPFLKKYFRQGVGRAESLYRIKPEIRGLLNFQQINLSTPPYPVPRDLDIIFCRNVMIYFNQDTRKTLVHHFEQMLKPGGYLFVGMAESLSGVDKHLSSLEPSVYQKARA